MDPHIRVLSTANVPPQRRDWWAEELRGTVPQLAALPAELFTQIINQVDDPWGMERAEQIREELMSTRGGINDQINQDMDEVRALAGVLSPLFLSSPALTHDSGMVYTSIFLFFPFEN